MPDLNIPNIPKDSTVFYILKALNQLKWLKFILNCKWEFVLTWLSYEYWNSKMFLFLPSGFPLTKYRSYEISESKSETYSHSQVRGLRRQATRLRYQNLLKQNNKWETYEEFSKQLLFLLLLKCNRGKWCIYKCKMTSKLQNLLATPSEHLIFIKHTNLYNPAIFHT